MRTEKVQREDAILTDARERRSSIAVHLQRYSDLLTEVRDSSRAAKLEIQHGADGVLKRLYYLVDDFAAPEPPRHARHLFHDMSEQIFESFLPELSFQYEENILMRYAGVRRRLREIGEADDQAQSGSDAPGGVASMLMRLVRRRVAPVGYTPEQRLLSSKSFVETYRDLNLRFDQVSGRGLLLASIDHIEEFCEAQRRLRPVLESCHERLSAALDRNSSEEFKVRESPELWSKMQGEMRALGLMARLNLGDIKHFRTHDVVDAVPEIVYAGAVLYTFVMVADRSRYTSDPMR